jgi:hypothetical protein
VHTNVARLGYLLPWYQSCYDCVSNCNVVKLNVEGNNNYQLWYNIFSLAPALSFNAIVAQASSKPKLFTHELLFRFPFYVFMLFFLMIPNIMSCEQ